VAVSQRAAFSHALIDGRAVAEFDSGGKAAHEIARLWDNIKRDIGL
jgi:chromosome partitioning protein